MVMAKPKVYVETSIPSFYHEIRSEPEMVACRKWTRQWWDKSREEYHVVTSDAVLDELSREGHPDRKQTLSLMQNVELLPIEEETGEIVEAYIEHKLMPRNPVGDALHLALASQHKCDFLLTWNCKHLANANKFSHIEWVNTTLGLFVPTLVTPLGLLGGLGDGK